MPRHRAHDSTIVDGELGPSARMTKPQSHAPASPAVKQCVRYDSTRMRFYEWVDASLHSGRVIRSCLLGFASVDFIENLHRGLQVEQAARSFYRSRVSIRVR